MIKNPAKGTDNSMNKKSTEDINHECKAPENMRLVIKKKSSFAKLPSPDISSPLYGKIEDGTDDSDGYDERKYRNSIMKHSILFERMRKIRAAGERTKLFEDKEETYGEKHRDEQGETEKHLDGTLEFTENGKILRFGECEEIEITGDGTVIWRSADPISPELVFRKGERIATALFPHLDFLINIGAIPELPQKNCMTTEIYDNLSENGGSFVLEYLIELSAIEAESTRMTIDAYPLREI